MVEGSLEVGNKINNRHQGLWGNNLLGLEGKIKDQQGLVDKARDLGKGQLDFNRMHQELGVVGYLGRIKIVIHYRSRDKDLSKVNSHRNHLISQKKMKLKFSIHSKRVFQTLSLRQQDLNKYIWLSVVGMERYSFIQYQLKIQVF